jgi:serine/threonine protein kinase
VIPVNRKIGRYDVIRKLARGGMADVYLGQDAEGRTLALKVIERAPDPDTLEGIEAERRGSVLQEKLAAVDPRVVRIYDSGDVDGYFFLAMEYIEGEDLAEYIQRGPLAPASAANIAISVLETLEHAHTLEATIAAKTYHGIIHGDIKPRNIRIDPQGRVRLLDFGIAKALSLSRRLTRNEFGSVPYASPERLDSGDVDRMSDLWSVAVVLYEMVTGLQPYQAATTERLEQMVRSRIPPPPAPEPCPEPLRRILIKAMEPDPARRYQSAREFAADLRAFNNGGKVAAADETPDDSTRRTFRTEAADDSTRRTFNPPPPPPPITPPAKPKRRMTRATARILATFLLAVSAYGGYWFASDWLLWKGGQSLEEAVKTEALTDPDQIWQQWTELSQGRSSSFLLYGARHSVKQKLVAAADDVIATYRNSDLQPVSKAEWERARASLAKALMVDSGDDSVRGKLRLCEAQLALSGSRWTMAVMNTAVAKFNEAEQLIPKSPDPELGLARLYVYGFKDLDRGDAALQQAERRGYHLGSREKNLLADGYRQRADRLFYDTRNIRGLPQEKDQVQKAADDYKRALQLYQEIAPYGNSGAMIARVQSSLESVEFRLEQLKGDKHWWQ